MGCGKSTVGRNLARKTGKRFVDMDAYIEKKTGKTISEIFTDQGEDGFRDIEHEVCLELADKSNLIIATGGGALTFERNVRVFKGKDIIVLLDVPLERIRYRLRNDKGAVQQALSAVQGGVGRHCQGQKHPDPDYARGDGRGASLFS